MQLAGYKIVFFGFTICRRSDVRPWASKLFFILINRTDSDIKFVHSSLTDLDFQVVLERSTTLRECSGYSVCAGVRTPLTSCQEVMRQIFDSGRQRRRRSWENSAHERWPLVAMLHN